MTATVDAIELEEAMAVEGGSLTPLIERDINLIKHVQVELVVEIGSASLSVDELFALKVGDVVRLLEQVHEPASLCLDGKPVARGNLVAVQDNFAIQLTEIL